VQLEQYQRENGTPAQGDDAASARTRLGDLRALLRAEPRLLPSAAVFLTTALLARRRARRAIRSGDFATWLRDESSRS
jgi:chloramphenicol 3-O-phosphotransferase